MSEAYRAKQLKEAREILAKQEKRRQGLSKYAKDQGLALEDIPSSSEGIKILEQYNKDYDKLLKNQAEDKRIAATRAAGGSEISKSVYGVAVDSLQAVTKAPTEAPTGPKKIDYSNAPVMGPIYQPEATPKADKFLAKFDPSELVTKNNQGNNVRDYNPQNLAAAERAFNMNQNKIANQARTDKRKDFASQLNAANYNPATASSEDKANFYAMGKDMGLSSDQIDSYANKQLDKQAERDYKRANMGKFLDTVDSQRSNRATTQGASGGLQRNRTGSNIRTSQADLDKEERRRNRS